MDLENEKMLAESLRTAVRFYTQKDYVRAFELFNQVSYGSRNYPVAQMYLGLIYLKGHGTELDYVKAFNHFKEAAKEGHPKAQGIVGEFLFNWSLWSR